MSNLQIGLAVAGGAVLAAVVAHGAWSSRRHAPRQAEPLAGSGPDAAAAPADPALGDDGFADTQPMSQADAARRSNLDVLIDSIAHLTLETPQTRVSGEAALAALPASRRAGSKPLLIEGLNALTQHWEVPTPGQRYSAFQAGVQLANRSGALNEIEYSEFVVKTQAFADAVNATAEFADMLEEVARARELDLFASAHDAQLGFTVRACGVSWSPGYVQQHAARQGFVAGAVPGRLVLPARIPGQVVLVLGYDAQAALAEDPAQSALRTITLHLDVAQVDRREEPFARMRAVAAALAQAMEGVVTDDNAQPLGAGAMDQIGAELQALYTTLEQRDLAAGSWLARRLFA